MNTDVCLETKELKLAGSTFQMSTGDWRMVNRLIQTHKQERLMRWWATTFEMSLVQAAGFINRLQIGLELGLV